MKNNNESFVINNMIDYSFYNDITDESRIRVANLTRDKIRDTLWFNIAVDVKDGVCIQIRDRLDING